jgi:hypothetical protein
MEALSLLIVIALAIWGLFSLPIVIALETSELLLPSIIIALRLTTVIMYNVARYVIVRYHCGGWSEEVNSCILISYMVYL